MKKTALKELIATSGLANNKALQVCRELAGMARKDGRPYQTGMINGNVIRPCYCICDGRYTKYADHTEAICTTLDRFGIEYTVGNDAPRGGKKGNYIKLITQIEE